MKTILIRFLAFILALMTLGTALSACADPGENDITAENTDVTEVPASENETLPETEPAPKVYLTINAANASSANKFSFF